MPWKLNEARRRHERDRAKDSGAGGYEADVLVRLIGVYPLGA